MVIGIAPTMLDDAHKAAIEAYLVHRDKGFKLRQERAIRDHLDGVLDKRASERRAWAGFVFGIGGTTLAGIVFFAWQAALGIVETRLNTAIEKQDERFTAWEEKANDVSVKFALAAARFDAEAEALKKLQIEVDDLKGKLSAFTEISATQKLAGENFVDVISLRDRINKFDLQLIELRRELARLERAFVTIPKDEPECTLEKRRNDEC